MHTEHHDRARGNLHRHGVDFLTAHAATYEARRSSTIAGAQQGAGPDAGLAPGDPPTPPRRH